VSAVAAEAARKPSLQSQAVPEAAVRRASVLPQAETGDSSTDDKAAQLYAQMKARAEAKEAARKEAAAKAAAEAAEKGLPPPAAAPAPAPAAPAPAAAAKPEPALAEDQKDKKGLFGGMFGKKK
jgi:hypothetical protein